MVEQPTTQQDLAPAATLPEIGGLIPLALPGEFRFNATSHFFKCFRDLGFAVSKSQAAPADSAAALPPIFARSNAAERRADALFATVDAPAVRALFGQEAAMDEKAAVCCCVGGDARARAAFVGSVFGRSLCADAPDALPGVWAAPQLLETRVSAGASVKKTLLLFVDGAFATESAAANKIIALALLVPSVLVVHPPPTLAFLARTLQEVLPQNSLAMLRICLPGMVALLPPSQQQKELEGEGIASDSSEPVGSAEGEEESGGSISALFGSHERASAVCRTASASIEELAGEIKEALSVSKMLRGAQMSVYDVFSLISAATVSLSERAALPEEFVRSFVDSFQHQEFDRLKLAATRAFEANKSPEEDEGAQVTPSDFHKRCAQAVISIIEQVAEVLPVLAPEGDDRALEPIAAKLVEELKAEQSAVYIKAASDLCQYQIGRAIQDLVNTPHQTEEHFLEDGERRLVVLQEEFSKFEPWTTPILQTWENAVKEALSKIKGSAQEVYYGIVRRSAKTFFDAIDAAFPTTPDIKALPQAFSAAIASKASELRFSQFSLALPDIDADVREYYARVAQPFMHHENLGELLHKFYNRFVSAAAERFVEQGIQIRHAILSKFLAPELLAPPYTDLSAEELFQRIDFKSLLSERNWGPLFELLLAKHSVANAALRDVVQKRGEEKMPSVIIDLAREVPTIFHGAVLQLVQSRQFAEFRVPCKDRSDEEYWAKYFAGYGIASTKRGNGPTLHDGRYLVCFSLSIPTGADPFAAFVGQDMNMREKHFAVALLFEPTVALLRFRAVQRADLALFLMNQIVVRSGVLPLGIECVGQGVYAIHLANESDLSKVCACEVTAQSETARPTTCPRLRVRSAESAQEILMRTIRGAGSPFHPLLAIVPSSENTTELFFAETEFVQKLDAKKAEIFGEIATTTVVEEKDFGAILGKLWDPQLFSSVRTLRSIADVDGLRASKAWDPVVWLSRYRDFEAGARMRDPSGRMVWRDESLCGMRVLVAASTQRFLSGEPVEQCNRSSDSTSLDAVTGFTTINLPQPVVGATVKETSIAPLPERPRFAATQVRVVNIDCFEMARQLQAIFPGKTIAVLNMANQYRPGGGWTRGRFAQEEGLFFRTSLSASLVQDLYNGPAGFGEFSCIYTKNVCVLRDDVHHGFAFLPEDRRWSVDFVTAAAYDLNNPHDKSLPPLPFTGEVAAKTRVKIEQVLATSAKMGADVVVMSAMGCGAFRNPSQEVAAIFREVITQYAGVFDRLYFAILGSREDKKIADFASTLVGTAPEVVQACCTPATDVTTLEGIFHAYMPVPGLPPPPTDVRKKICAFAGGCADPDPNHFYAFEHPPFCPNGDACTNQDPIHRQMFFHKKLCPNAFFCRVKSSFSPEVAADHNRRFAHQALTFDALAHGDVRLVCLFAASCGFDEALCQKLATNKIRGEILVQLGMQDYLAMGIPYADAFVLSKQLSQLRKPQPVQVLTVAGGGSGPRALHSKYEAPIGNSFLFLGSLKFPPGYAPATSCKDALLSQEAPFTAYGIPEIRSIVEETEMAVHSLKQSPKLNELILAYNLTDDELFAIVAFSHDIGMRGSVENNLFFQVNAILQRRIGNELFVIKDFVFYLLSGLSKLPDVEAEAFRGLPADSVSSNEFTQGREIFFSSFVHATSEAANAALAAGRGGILLQLSVKHAKAVWPFSMHHDKSELLLLPNMSFIVANPPTPDQANGFEVVGLLETGIALQK